MRRLALCTALLALSGCATAYQSKGMTGGFSETHLSERVYQVRFRGNGYTSQDRVSEFILRRCAELTLEHGFRWFTLGAQGSGAMTSGANGLIFSSPHGTATVRFLEKEADDPLPIDSVFVIRETDERAGGKLSEKARQTLAAIPPPAPLTK